MKKTHAAVTGNQSALARYQDVVIGERSLTTLLYYEFCQLFTYVPGSIGMVLRKLFWPRLFQSCGKKCLFGAGVVLRQPKKMVLGNAVVVSEGCVLDGRSSAATAAISIGDNVILSNQVMLSCKEGTITIGDQVGINAQTIVQSTNQNPVVIDADCVIGQRCFIIGGGNYDISNSDGLIREQPIAADGGVHLAGNVWLGGNVTVLGGVSMGAGSVAAAGAVVSTTIPAKSICMGVPARVVKTRG